MRIGCDIDAVVVDTPTAWLRWLEKVCDIKIHEMYQWSVEEGRQVIDYNLTYYFKEELEALGMDGYEWWRSDVLYHDLKPYEEAVEVLQEMSDKGAKINFITKIKGNQNRNKSYWIKRHFPFCNAIIATHEKGECKADIMIDDRLENLYQFDETVLKILYNTPFKQNLPLREDVIVADSWEDVRNILLLELEARELGNICAK